MVPLGPSYNYIMYTTIVTMKYRRIPLLLMLLVSSAVIWAQGPQRKVRFAVIDAQDKVSIWNYTATLMTADSTVVKTVVAQEDTTMMIQAWGTTISFTGKGKFILRLTSVGYETLDTPFEIKQNRQTEVNLGMLKMNPDSKLLNEVVVTGTKIKMVMRGDTVVFNADAFKLAEGSMLDALIAQFPGAEMSSDGEIKVNGRKIESLLVDGRDFFAGDPKAALKNLPAYTVNKVKVFDRDGKDTEMMGRDMGDRQYVMDVRLKKQYQRSVMGNFRLGGGTDNRFLADGMLRAARGKSTLGITARANNVNDIGDMPMGVPITSDMIMAMQNPTGVNINRSYGLSYGYGEYTDPLFVSASSTYSHNNAANENWTSSQTYLTGGDTYGRSSNNSRNRNISWSNNIFFVASPKGLHANGNISYNYNSGKTYSNSLSASFDQDPSTYTDILHDVFNHPERYHDLTLNMMKSASESETSSNNAMANIMANFKVGSDMLKTSLTFNHSHQKNDRFSLNDLRYPKNDMRDFRHEYNPAPSNSTNVNVSAGYDYALGRHGIGLNYSFGYQYNSNESMLYRLDRLAGNDSTTLHMLPSARDVMRDIIDDANSYNYDSRSFIHMVSADLRWKPIENKKEVTQGMFLPTSGDLLFALTLPLAWVKRDMNYFRQRESRVDQNNLFFNPSLRVNYRKSDKDGLLFIGLNADINTTAPDMLSLIDYRDDSNPLNVRLGNPNLKNSRNYHLNAVWNNNWNKSMGMLNFSFNYTRMDNQVAYSMVYDKETGVQTTQPTNVNGNWNTNVSMTVGRGIGWMANNKKTLSFENQTSFNYQHSVDLATIAGQNESQRNTVNNSSLSDRLTVRWRVGANSELTFNGSGTYNYTKGDRADFKTIHAGDFSYGVNALLALPWKLQLSTDLTNFSHRGYSASEMNTDELIWNASLSKTFLKGSLIFTLKGTDLLGNLKNRQFNINEQGRTETFNNVIPRYAMLSVSYRFNTMPKQRKSRAGIMVWQ